MILLALTSFFAASSVVAAVPAEDSTIVSRSVPACSTLGTNPDNKPCFGPYINGSTPESLRRFYRGDIASRSVPPCIELGPNPANKPCFGDYLNSTKPNSTLSRRHHEEAQNSLPEWSEPVKGGWSGGNMTEFCIRDGPAPKAEDIKILCEKIDDNQIIARTKQKSDKEREGNCFCKKFHRGTAWFKVCNCDRCNRLEIISGMKEICKASTDLCASKGYSSAFMRLDESNGLLVQYNVEPKNATSGKIERDPMQAKPELTKSTCLSNDEFQQNQDYTGPVVECWRSWKALWMARKCHDHSHDARNYRSEDYWHNKWIQYNIHNPLHWSRK
ncbi:hypothetical protein N431DRAFT_461174 [Stipitochalara longipes BDJ]|nr:hypothetical protein N431DRAFT_461174 [Stipitochalara longipes BDJ]